jgi:hypothetical protein
VLFCTYSEDFYLIVSGEQYEKDDQFPVNPPLPNLCGKRPARAFLLPTRYGKKDGPQRMLPQISREILAGRIVATRPRVNCFRKEFEEPRFIGYEGRLQRYDSLLNIALHD